MCNCSAGGDTGVKAGHLTENQIMDQDARYCTVLYCAVLYRTVLYARYRWETYDRVDRLGITYNTLTDPRSRDFLELKRNIEAKV